MNSASSLSDSQRQTARRNATFSALYGCISEFMLDHSAFIITYIALLNGSNMFSMLSAAMGGLASVFLLIPLANLNEKFGLRRAVRVTCSIGFAAFLLMASAPFWGQYACQIVILAAFVFHFARPMYINSWYPLLDNFLLPGERTGFFVKMRFLYMLENLLLFTLLGFIIGKNPPIWLYQLIIAITAVTILGRTYYIDRLPEEKKLTEKKYDFVTAFRKVVRNRSLTGFSVYVCFVTLFYTALVPLTFIYLKSHFELAPSRVVSISGLVMSGSTIGFLVAGKLQRFFGTKWLLIICHIAYILISLACFLCGEGSAYPVLSLTLLMVLQGFVTASWGVCFSLEIMALASPGNKIMATAFCQTYVAAGNAIGRIGTSLVIGSAALAPFWQVKERVYNSFQTLYLFYTLGLILCLVLLFLIPAVITKSEEYYQP